MQEKKKNQQSPVRMLYPKDTIMHAFINSGFAIPESLFPVIIALDFLSNEQLTTAGLASIIARVILEFYKISRNVEYSQRLIRKVRNEQGAADGGENTDFFSDETPSKLSVLLAPNQDKKRK